MRRTTPRPCRQRFYCRQSVGKCFGIRGSVGNVKAGRSVRNKRVAHSHLSHLAARWLVAPDTHLKAPERERIRW